ncbi:MAG: hypothetical protein K2M04_02225 [Muribaculaceae bacterium]|nr:hypothetical protein [Muribaculaceae bacterium]
MTTNSLPTTSLSSSDTLHATVIRAGRTLVSVPISGMSTMADVLRFIASLLHDLSGMVTLRLRNVSQGWTQQRAIMIAA